MEEVNILFQGPLLLVDGGVQSSEPSLTALLAVTSCIGHFVFACGVIILLEVVQDSVIQSLSDVRPILSTVISDELYEDLIFFLRPFGFVSSEFLNEEPSLVTFLCILSGNYLSNLLPVLVVKLLYKLGILHHEGE